MKAIGFDLGNTLVEYEGVPLNWEQHYPAALAELAGCLDVRLSTGQFDAGSAVLRRFNTRLHPREEEIGFDAILAELLACFGLRPAADEERCATAFFRTFQRRLRPFADARPALVALRQRHCGIGVFTDVPYGMPRSLVLRDLSDAALTDRIDVLLTSRETGYRKPAVATLRALATALDCEPRQMAYVGDEPKDIEAARRFGCRAILLDRHQRHANCGQDQTIASLLELAEANEQIFPHE